VRDELCCEAIRLTLLIAEDRTVGTPATDALLAMMYLDFARLPSRVDDEGVFLPLSRQDRSRWDKRLIALGFRYLGASAEGDELTRFHVEAAIAAEHCRAASFEVTDWRRIMEMYERLVAISPTPVVALNRAIVRGQVDGPAAGLAALDALGASDFFNSYPFFHAALGEFRLRSGQSNEAANAFKKALDCARSPGERTFFARRLNQVRESPSAQQGYAV
jgi:predicted RNA polymerase sigma factor